MGARGRGKPDGSRDSAAFEVREALAHTGCAVCRLTMRSVGRLMKSIAYEQVNDIEVRADLRSARGFCNAHAHRWLREVPSPLGTAIVYRDILRASVRDLDTTEAPPREPRGGLLGTLLRATQTDRRSRGCLACRMQREAESRYVQTLVSLLTAEEEVRGLSAASEGLCRRHVQMALRRGGPGAALVVQHTLSRIERCIRDLDEVIRKEDYRFRHEPRTDDERTAPARAVTWAAGIDGIVDTE